MRRIFLFCVMLMILTACASRQPDATTTTDPASAASMCEILKQQLSASNYQDYDQATMKRKNAGDQARIVQEYNAYGCPEIIEQLERPSPTS